MCGRYTLATPAEWIRDSFELDFTPELGPRYNIAPTQDAPVFLLRDGRRRLEWLRWGLVPSWARDASVGNRMINARAETVREKPAFRNAFRQRRCLVPADGFYEWRRIGALKIPMRFRRRDRCPFAFGGLREHWTGPDGNALHTFTILTTEANELVRPIHDRMPLVLDPRHYALWLDADADPERVAELLRPDPLPDFEAYEVSTLVNNPRNDDPACIEPESR